MKNNILTASILADTGSNNISGQVYAANASRFGSTHYSDPLTAYTVGWRDPENLDALLEQLFPAVDVGRRFEFKKADNAEAFLSELEDTRAIGAEFKRVEYSGTTVNEKTQNKGLTTRVDKDDEVGDGWRENYTGMLMARLTRNELRRGVAILNAGATNVAKVWGNAANPDADFRAQLRAAKIEGGIRPNQIAMGGALWDLRSDSYESQNTPHAGRRADMTVEQFASKLAVAKAIVSEALYTVSAAAKADIISSIALLYYARSGMMKDDPSNVKRFTSPTSQGSRFAVYIEEHPKYTDITVEHYSNIVITSTLGLRKITATAA